MFSTNVANNFTVEADHTLTLTYESCNYFFTNSGAGDLEYCWSDFVGQVRLTLAAVSSNTPEF